MPVPKKKTTRSARNQRRSHHALKKSNLNACPKCQEPVQPHRVCLACGTYNNKQVLEVKTKDSKEKKKDKDKPEEKK